MLTALALRWLSPSHVANFAADFTDPHDADEELSLEEAAEAYRDLGEAKAIRAKDIAERMLEYEWRSGLTALGVAEVEWECLFLRLPSARACPADLRRSTVASDEREMAIVPLARTHALVATAHSPAHLYPRPCRLHLPFPHHPHLGPPTPDAPADSAASAVVHAPHLAGPSAG